MSTVCDAPVREATQARIEDSPLWILEIWLHLTSMGVVLPHPDHRDTVLLRLDEDNWELTTEMREFFLRPGKLTLNHDTVVVHLRNVPGWIYVKIYRGDKCISSVRF